MGYYYKYDSDGKLVDLGEVVDLQKWALCMNCLRIWNTTSRKSTIQCPDCRSHTSNISDTPKECYTNYSLAMCPRCQYIWFTKSKQNRVECWNCRKTKEKRRRRLKSEYIIYFHNRFNDDPDNIRKLLILRFPKAKDIICKWKSRQEQMEYEYKKMNKNI